MKLITKQTYVSYTFNTEEERDDYVEKMKADGWDAEIGLFYDYEDGNDYTRPFAGFYKEVK